MAAPNRSNQNRNSPQREYPPQKPVDLTLPEIAIEYGIDKAMWLSLKNLYPGAQDNSIVMVYEYCKARGLDPLKKPVHIVPMYVEDKATKVKAYRDVIMPGIQEMRTTAMRTKEYAGQDEAKLGKTIEVAVGGESNLMMQVPEFATVTVYKLTAGKRYAYSHTEYFLEAVARTTAGMINTMWQKRPRGQLTKCAEAGALRKAFPEELGGEYAAEEMEGQNTFVEPTGLPEPENGASGIVEPEVLPKPELRQEPDDENERAQDPAGMQPDERDDVTRALSPDERAEAKRAVAERDALVQRKPAEPDPNYNPTPPPAPRTKAAPAAEPKPEPVAPAGDFSINLPEGAKKVLTSQMAVKGVTEDQLLAKLGGSVEIANINQALALVRDWE